MATTNGWLDVLGGRSSAEETRDLLTQGAAHLDDFLKSHPQAEQRVLDILGRRLSDGNDADTWNTMHASLSQYFTEELAYMLYWVVGVEDPSADRMQELDGRASPEVIGFLRAVVGIYGVDLSNAFAVVNEVPDNWRNFRREVYFDMLRQRHHLRVGIRKYNGEEVIIEGPADFVLNLAGALMYTARVVGTREAFSKDSIDNFLEEARQLTELLTAEQKERADLSGPEA